MRYLVDKLIPETERIRGGMDNPNAYTTKRGRDRIRRIPDEEALCRETAAWGSEQNDRARAIGWQSLTEDASMAPA
jgi:hypothetical protein